MGPEQLSDCHEEMDFELDQLNVEMNSWKRSGKTIHNHSVVTVFVEGLGSRDHQSLCYCYRFQLLHRLRQNMLMHEDYAADCEHCLRCPCNYLYDCYYHGFGMNIDHVRY